MSHYTLQIANASCIHEYCKNYLIHIIRGTNDNFEEKVQS